jgi:phosphoribosyl 1,2-cyclic phosphate phosphodiesterase
MFVTLMGTGTSHGVPVLGCNCPTCTSADIRDGRTRSSAHIRVDGVHILIDTATELRIQSLRNRIQQIDLVLMTHYHADHISGFDDLRCFNELQGGTIPVYGNHETLRRIETVYDYIFDDSAQLGGGKPTVSLNEAARPFSTRNILITPVLVKHGKLPVNGYRIKNMAYVTDCSEIPDSSMNLLQNLELLILGVLRFTPHPTHLNLDAGLEVIRRLKPKRTILTHICHDFKHSDSENWLPPGVELGYDGQQVEVRY